ncbi:hypothetical protein DL96DRAFT_1552829 [Flagelloscypha sp. PMI_526]|nr:hypothetical protein DL96DRAFT_1552829 [Flagelloscypha sp. PMI_526]
MSGVTCSSLPFVELPAEIWDEIFGHLSKADLWPLRSLNRIAYEIAARVCYGSLWIVPLKGEALTGVLKRAWFQITGLVHTLHVHSNIDVYLSSSVMSENKKLSVQKRHQRLIDKLVSSPNLRVHKLTMHYDTIVLPHTRLIWLGVAESLVHLELQFNHSSACDSFISLSGKVHCLKLQRFVLSLGTGENEPLYYSPTLMKFGKAWMTPPPSKFPPIFKVLQDILPPGLSSLGIHSSYSYGPDHVSRILTSSQALFHPKAFPDLKALYISGVSLARNPSIAQFLLARAPSLRCLSLEGVSDIPGFLPRLARIEKLEELYLDRPSYEELFQPASFLSGFTSPIFQHYTHLRRLDVRGTSNYADDVFRLMVEVGRAGCRIEALNLTLKKLLFLHLRVTLLLLPTVTDLSFSNVKSCDSLMCRLSQHPLWMDLDGYKPRVYRFVGLAKAGMRLGPVIRRAMTAEFRKDIDKMYSDCVSSLAKKDALYSSIKTALKAGEAGGSMASRHEAPGEDHRKATLDLVEGCLVSSSAVKHPSSSYTTLYD